ncbi:MAG: T9SS type A sorting domain-containing protein [Dysgonamonadaceae bacterium]|jgi:hypothetical protein|nr:T9SS type A sorting domain-containing protein [Dysgonamonadaceae bacterium]
MKLNYFLKSFALLTLISLAMSVNVKATDYHVADGATDTQLAAVLDQASTGDVILIDGWVTINAMVHVTKNVTIKAGTTSICGFDGGGNSRLFEIHPEPVEGAKLVFENLDFTGGNGWASDPTDGGAARIYGGTTEFIQCYFYENVSKRGGAFFIVENGTTAIFKGCEAFDNLAQGDGGESRGGYLFTDGETHITHEYCKIYSNRSIGGRGGALCLFGNGTRYFYYTTITNNYGGNWSEDGTTKLDKDGNPVSDGEYEGAVGFITGGATTFESCGIVGNQSWSHSGIIRGWGDANTTVTFINTNLAKNQSMHDRSPLWIGGNATYTFVNSFLVENQGQNAGNGAGFDFDGASVILNIFNSVFAHNVAGGDGAVDIRNASNYATQLVVKNSLIGLIQGNSSVVVPQDNPNIPTKSNIALYKIADEQSQIDYAILEPATGINYGQGLRFSKSFKMPYYLLDPAGTVAKLGDPALLADYDTNHDLFDNTRTTAADGSISAAPTVATITDDEYDDSGWEDKIFTGISSPSVSGTIGAFRVIGYVSNGILGIDFGSIKGQTRGTLISLTGQAVQEVFNCNVVAKGYYNVDVRPGVYLLRLVNNGKTYVQKVVVK